MLGHLSIGIFERRAATGSVAFSLLICLVATTFVLLNVFSRMETIYSKICAKPPPMNAKRPLPVTVRRLKPPIGGNRPFLCGPLVQLLCVSASLLQVIKQKEMRRSV